MTLAPQNARAQKIAPPPITWCDAPALKPEWAEQPAHASFSLFTLYMPRPRPVERVKNTRDQYPPNAMGWDASLIFHFDVDTSGKADVSTIRSVPAMENIVFDNDKQRETYLAFVKASATMIEHATFKPAEILGCRVRQPVSLPMQFRTRNP